jgi:pimeloyl-ACP methyl ester carboxylesterase
MRLNVVEAGRGDALVLLHGLFGSAPNLGAVQKALAPRHRVLALDLRNHGASPHAAGMSYATMADDVAETMHDAGIASAAVVGHSMGGKAAMALALRHPARVTRLVVADIAPVRYAPALRGHVAAMQALPLRKGLTRREADAALAASVPAPGERAFLLQNLRFEDDPPRWRLGLAGIAAAMEEIEGFDATGKNDLPVLFLSGGRSGYVRPEHVPAIRALFPQARFETIPEAGHWLHAEQPAAFLAAVTRFLDEGG